jgi:phospholipid/cholesterol/gamma-HCH transport system substrate-binding protein
MTRTIGRWRALFNLGFVLGVLGLGGFGLYQVAGRNWQVQRIFRVRAQFEAISGLEAGHRVRLLGMDAGVVERVVPPSEPGRPVELILRIDEQLRRLVRTDAVARIVSEGLAGAKVVEITPGRADAPPVAELGRIGSERPIEMTDLLRKATGSLARLDEMTQAAETGVRQLNAITGSIQAGEGSVGKLIRDETLYRNLIELSRRGERSVTALAENLEALKQTWPLSRYFDRRAYLDRERVLFQPGSARRSRTLKADDLFERDRSVLTPAGKRQLDEIARWCNQASRPTSEVVIAAFTDVEKDEGLAEILTQEQADAVRKYLVDQHAIQSAGWFRSRKVASVGFGTHPPRLLESGSGELPTRRVEIVVFTPQA